nr:YadA-like family protein [Dyella subtropica]
MAFGYSAQSTASSSIALGAYSVADRANTVSVGTATAQRQIVNVANGTQANDAVNLSQLHTATKYFNAKAPAGTDGDSVVTGAGDVAIGGLAQAVSDGSGSALAVGSGARALANRAAAIGGAATANKVGDTALGGVGGTFINNLKGGLIASGSMQAVNGGQLFDFQQDVSNQFNLLTSQYNSMNDRIGTIKQGVADGTIGGGGGVSPGTGSDSTQVGDGAVASGDNSSAVGSGAVASGDNGTAIGSGAVASGDSSTATGAGSQATGDNSTATGAGSLASGNNSTANGAGAVASGDGSTALGQGASATGADSTALGSNSNATGNNSVALGAGSVADRDNTVSVGSEGSERQITNVAAGTQRTDAANWGQVQDAVNGVQDWANHKFSQQDTRINRIGAMGAAYGQMAFSAQGIQTPNKVGVGVGTQGGLAALAVGYSRQIKPNVNLSFGGSASGSEVSVGAGLSMGW